MVSLASSGRAISGIITPSAGGSLKRKHTDSDFDSDVILSSQTKRQRVAFDPDVEIRILEDWDEKSFELVREEVRRGLDRHRADDSVGYDMIKQFLTTRPSAEDAPSSALLRKYVLALTSQVASLNTKCSGLVHAILGCNWLVRSEQFVGSYIRLLGGLMSAHGVWSAPVLQMIADKFAQLPSPSFHHPDDPRPQRPQLQSRVHQCLRYLLRLIPSASSTLSPILCSAFPFSTDTAKVHIDYIQNILKLIEYSPELKGTVIALIMERLVKIDVQIQIDMDDLEEDIEDSLVQDGRAKRIEQVEDEDEADDDSDDESVSSEESLPDEERHLKELKESVRKMDSILDLLFNYYHPIFAQGNTYDISDAFDQLLSQFSSIILPTYRSRHTQFLLFHFGQSSPSLIDRFAGVCANIAFKPEHPHLIRLASAAYLASFIARGAHISAEVVRQVFSLLGTQLDKLRQTNEYKCTGPDLRRFGSYYAIAQALLYIFCFRWRDLIVGSDNDYDVLNDDELLYEGHDLLWVPDIKEVLTRNIYSKFNPLKICAPTIVLQFARIAHHLRFLYVFPLLETNKRLRLARSLGSYGERETALSKKKGEEGFQLDAYFPFDPYHLPRSKRWIEGDYVEWKSIPGLDDGREEEEGSEEEDSDSNGEDDEDEDEDEVAGDLEGEIASTVASSV
ncbi:RNA polymerase I-specific transcription initiation factor RRN3 [Lepidopterella palustris CBS 459.81]|uniref:RNA polymerase I-specific transcription initiation factor RRN3 n=1 Tax=Lepidopterella palustris CBS 459.81 TaxID=1314670 RepID=A0A8E2E594_9PEZI|nr:RNA polymerase I-specific transcription initiation factor RRN3 [Lepidopterella palustris CBS 459.81]